VAYAACHNFSDGDYKPYVYKTVDGGRTWTAINANLPKKGCTYSIAEDHVDPNLLFVGTLFGLYFSNTGGQEWVAFNNGMPPASVTDISIQRRENDLAVSTFGRGIYVLDDYSPLRSLTKETLQKDVTLFPVKDAFMFIPSNPFGFPGIGFQGAGFFAAPNPDVGAVFTFYVKDEYKSLKQKRRDAEKEKQKKGEEIEIPPYRVLRQEADELEPFLMLTVRDEAGSPVRRIKTPVKKGVNRIAWDFRMNVFTPISLTPFDNSIPWNEPDKGYMVVPGKYTVSMSRFDNGKWTDVGSPQTLTCRPLKEGALPGADHKKLDAFNREVAELIRAVSSADAYRDALADKIPFLTRAVIETAGLPDTTYATLTLIAEELKILNRKLNGDGLRATYEGAAPTSVRARVEVITGSLWSTTSDPTTTFIHLYEVASGQFDEILNSLKSVGEEVLKVEAVLDKYGSPYTPGRLPEWKKN